MRRGCNRIVIRAPTSGKIFVFEPLHYLALIEQ